MACCVKRMGLTVSTVVCQACHWMVGKAGHGIVDVWYGMACYGEMGCYGMLSPWNGMVRFGMVRYIYASIHLQTYSCLSLKTYLIVDNTHSSVNIRFLNLSRETGGAV